ncbi:bel12-ag transposon polyprotein, partial [Nephila pilipes]
FYEASPEISLHQDLLWTNSSTVLTWIIRREQWSVFVTNRISEIRKLTTSEDWLLISTDQNPADILSSGCGPKQLQKCKWWQGPAWLQNPKEQWPKSAVNIDEKEVEIEKRKSVISANNTKLESISLQLARRFSKMIRVMAWDIPLNNVSDLDQIEKTNIVLRWRYIQKVRENLKQRFKREYLGFLHSSVTKREDKINVGDIVLIGTDDKKRLHWLLGRVLELFPSKDGIIRLVKLRTEKGNVLRPIQRLYPLELKPNYEQVVSENRKVPEVVTEYPELNTDCKKTVPMTRSGREIKQVERLNL